MIFLACTGFFILFNTHGWGSALCAAGGVLTWMVYLLCRSLGFSIYGMNFIAAIVAALYSEIMARSRKYPVTSYLVISEHSAAAAPGIYYTMSLGLGGDVPRRRCTKDSRLRVSRAALPWRSCWYHGVPPCDRAAQKPNEIINSRKSAAQRAALFSSMFHRGKRSARQNHRGGRRKCLDFLC